MIICVREGVAKRVGVGGMGAFKKAEGKDRLVLKQRGGAVVFLESEDDFQIIAEHWFFNEGENILFKSADPYEKGAGGGGCKAVIDLVEMYRGDGIEACGRVDRCWRRTIPMPWYWLCCTTSVAVSRKKLLPTSCTACGSR